MISVAILGCGMMGQEHVSYIEKYPNLHIKFLCDPYHESLKKTLSLIDKKEKPKLVNHEDYLISYVNEIDLLVIATPNYLHTPQLLRWAIYPITILIEKPVAVCQSQIDMLKIYRPNFCANIWVAMEYRFIPAIQKLIQLLSNIGECKTITIRENRYPFLSKIGEWNKDIDKSGDTLVEKCCHFFDLFRLISGSEMQACTTKVHRGVLWNNYGYDKRIDSPVPIIDSAYVLLDLNRQFHSHDYNSESNNPHLNLYTMHQPIIGCLELCMFAEGARHQEEIIVAGTKGRLEAYLPENKVFFYKRPNEIEWSDRSKPPPKCSIKEVIFDCSDLSQVYPFAEKIPRHSGYHYCSTAIEWKYLIDAIEDARSSSTFIPHVSLQDGIAAVEMGISALKNITNGRDFTSSEETVKLALSLALD